jgi:hypothetical protein
LPLLEEVLGSSPWQRIRLPDTPGTDSMTINTSARSRWGLRDKFSTV